MSSMRNAVERRNHRERGQPEERKKWGLLEKHKDYSARAKDFNAKKTKLKALKAKVAEKNPDEFYFGMLSRKGPATTGKNRTGTVDGDRGNKVLGQDVVRLYKTQDLGYIRTARNKAAKEVEDLEKRAVGIRGRGRKVVFVEGVEEQAQRLREAEGRNGDEMDEDEDDDEEDFPGEDLQTKKLRKLKEKEIEKLESRLDTARERLKALAEAEEALELQRARMARTPTVGGINKQGVKFKVRERKR